MKRKNQFWQGIKSFVSCVVLGVVLAYASYSFILGEFVKFNL